MSSALFHFFWDTADWGGAPPAPSPSPAPAQDLGSGGHGGSKSHDDYYPANSDYWEAREAYLRSLQQEMALELPIAATAPQPVISRAPAPANPQFATAWKLPRFLAERDHAISAVHSAPDLASLHAAGNRLRQLNHAVRDAHVARLALDRHIRVTKRNVVLRRTKSNLARLMVLQALLHLIHPH